MTGNSFWKPKVEEAAATWLAETSPPIAGGHTADAVDREQDLRHVDAGLGRGLGIGADRVDLPAEGGQAQRDPGEQEHEQEDPDRHRDAEHVGPAQARELLAERDHLHARQVERDRAADEQGGQRRDEGRHAQPRDDEGVAGAEREPSVPATKKPNIGFQPFR